MGMGDHFFYPGFFRQTEGKDIGSRKHIHMHDIILFSLQKFPKGLYIAEIIFFHIGDVKHPATQAKDLRLVGNGAIHGYKVKGNSLLCQFPEIIHHEGFHASWIISKTYLKYFHKNQPPIILLYCSEIGPMSPYAISCPFSRIIALLQRRMT